MSEDSRYQINARIDELQGELKRAEEQDRLNAQELADRDHAQRLAQEAKAKSEANIARIKQALREAGQAYSEAVLALTGDGPVAVEAAIDYQLASFAKNSEIQARLLAVEAPTSCLSHGRAIYTSEDGRDVCAECERDYVPSPFPNAVFNGFEGDPAQ